MHPTLTGLAAALPAPSTPDFIKTAAITGILVFLVGVIIVWKGTGIVSKSDKQDVKRSMTTGANVGIGVVLVVIGLVGAAFPLIVSMLGYFTTVAP